MLTHGPHEILRYYQGVKHLARDQRLILETPGWRVLDFEENTLSESELERRKEHILRGPLVVRDREYPFAEDLIVDESEAPDATLPVVAKVSSLIEILRLGGPYELVNQLCSQFTLIASRVNIDLAGSPDEVLAGIFLLLVATYTWSLSYWCCVSVNHLEWHVPPHPCSCVWLGEGPWEVQHRVRRTRFRDLGHGADMGEVHVSTCLCCRAEPCATASAGSSARSLLDLGWIKGSEIEASRAECQSFVQEQRQLERSSTKSRPDIGDVLSFCSSQAGFRVRQHLFKVCIVTNMVKLRDW